MTRRAKTWNVSRREMLETGGAFIISVAFAGGSKARRARPEGHDYGWHRHRRQQENFLRRIDRWPLFCRATRLEQENRQSAVCAGKGQAETPAGLQGRRPIDSARRYRAQNLC